jgi:tRNA 2-thiouridine synthesizing protein A
MIDADHELDATGLICPEPLMLLRNRVRGMANGETIHIVATDPAADRDFRDFCRFLGHQLLDVRRTGERIDFWIRKGRA